MQRKSWIAVLFTVVILGIGAFFLKDSGIFPESWFAKKNSSEEQVTMEDLPGASDDPASMEEEKLKPEDEVEAHPPLLEGYVFGEGKGIPNATVMFFSVQEIELLLNRLERAIPTQPGIPHIPKLVNKIRSEMQRFRSRAILAETNEDGYYSMNEPIDGGHYMLTYAGRWLFKYGDVVCLDSKKTQRYDVTLQRGANLGGRVVGPGSIGLSGMRIVAEYRPNGANLGIGKMVRKVLGYLNGEFLKGPFEVRSDAEGYFDFGGLPAGQYDLVAISPKGLESYLSNVGTGSQNAVIYMGRAASVSGRLVDQDGQPMANIEMKIDVQDEPINLPMPIPELQEGIGMANRFLKDPPRNARSGKDGRFTILDLGKNKYTLSIENPMCKAKYERFELDWDEDKKLGDVKLDRGFSIEGTVVDADSVPLEGAAIVAMEKGAQGRRGGMSAMTNIITGRTRVLTDAKGNFVMYGLKDKEYNLIVTLDDYVPLRASEVFPGTEPLNFTLDHGITISGRVVDTSGNPVPMAMASANEVRARTDKDGIFVLKGLHEGGGMEFLFGGRRRFGAEPEEGEVKQIRLSVNATGYDVAEQKIDLVPADNIHVELKPAPSVKGIVLDPDGIPAPGALVRLTAALPQEIADMGFFDPALMIFGVGVSDLDGKFDIQKRVLFDAEGMDDYKIIASHISYARGETRAFSLDDVSESGEELEVSLLKDTRITGYAKDANGPVSGATMRLTVVSEGGGMGVQVEMFKTMLGLPKGGETATTNDEGFYEFTQIRPGKYSLVAEKVGFTDSPQSRFDLAAGDEKNFDFSIEAGGTLEGLVASESGEYLQGVTVRLLREDADEDVLTAQRYMGGSYKSAVTNSEGRFTFKGLPNDSSYTISVKHKDYALLEREGIYSGQAIDDLVLPAPAEFRFTVVDNAGEPVTKYGYQLRPAGNLYMRSDSGTKESADGEHIVTGLNPGKYNLSISAKGRISKRISVELQSGAFEEETIELGKAAKIRGKVVAYGTSDPIAFAQVQLIAKEDSDKKVGSQEEIFMRMSGGRRATTNQKGEYEIDDAPPGLHTVKVTHDSYIGAQKENVEASIESAGVVDFQLKKGLKISGEFTGKEIKEGEFKFLLLRGTDKDGISVTKTAWINGDNYKFSFDGLAEGTYRITSASMNMNEDDEEAEDFHLTQDIDNYIYRAQ